MARKNLLVVPAGHKSLRSSWIEKERSYDILVINYEQDEITSCGEEIKIKASGKKWKLIGDALVNDDFIRTYCYIAFFDDDMRFTRGGLNELFVLGEKLKLDLYQPSINAHTGFGTPWIHLLNVADSDFRWTNMVELMVPIMTPNLYIKSRIAFKDNCIGWGMDNCYWPTIMKEDNLQAAVVDRVVMEHTRKPFQNYDTTETMLDMTAMIENLKLREKAHFTYIKNSYHPDLEISEPQHI